MTRDADPRTPSPEAMSWLLALAGRGPAPPVSPPVAASVQRARLWSAPFSSSPSTTPSSSSTPSSFPFAGPSSAPIVPPVLVGNDFPEQKDPLAFVEFCPVRGVGALVVGGAFGLLLGGFFSGYGQLAPYDPALKDWQALQAKQLAAQQQAAAAATGAGGAAAAADGAAATAAAALKKPPPSSPFPAISAYSPVHLPPLITTPAAGAASPFAMASSMLGGSSSLANAARSSAAAGGVGLGLSSAAAAAAGPSTGAAAAAEGAVAAGAAVGAPHGGGGAAPALAHPSLGALPFPTEPPSVPLRVAFVQGLREMKTRSLASGKQFGIVGGVYTTIECFMEKARGRKDLPNAMMAGFVTGAVIAARTGPSGMVLGGAGFAAFSGVIEIVSPYIFDS
jgi:hypothetical protein